jgi:hypothetical protein
MITNFIRENLSFEELKQFYQLISNKLVTYEENQQSGIPSKRDKIIQNFLLDWLKQIKQHYREVNHGN